MEPLDGFKLVAPRIVKDSRGSMALNAQAVEHRIVDAFSIRNITDLSVLADFLAKTCNGSPQTMFCVSGAVAFRHSDTGEDDVVLLNPASVGVEFDGSVPLRFGNASEDLVLLIFTSEALAFEGGIDAFEVVHHSDMLDFDIKNAYLLFDVQKGATRGDHAHIEGYHQGLFIMNGQCHFEKESLTGDKVGVVMDDPYQVHEVMTHPEWLLLSEFVGGASVQVFTSGVYNPNNDIRVRADFDQLKSN